MPSVGKEPRRDLRKLSDDELEQYLHFAPDESIGEKLALDELTRRRLKSKTRRLTFWIGGIAAILVALVAIFIIRAHERF